MGAWRALSICRPHQRPCFRAGLGTVESKHSPNGLTKWSQERVTPKYPCGFCNVGLWIQGHLEGSSNLAHMHSHVGQIKLLSEHLRKSPHLPVCLPFSPRLYRHQTGLLVGQGAYLGKHKVSLHKVLIS